MTESLHFRKDPNEVVQEKLVIPLSSDQKSTPLSRLIEKRSQIERRLNRNQNVPEIEDKKEESTANEKREETLEQRAAREILESLKARENEKDEQKVFTLPLKADELPLDGAQEPTLDDYDKVPIGDFGKAMLRGMGWKDEDEKKSDKTDYPVQRPKGMGLGADKLIKPQPLLVAPGKEEKLEIKRNACVKVLAGKHKNLYGIVSNFIIFYTFK